MVVHVIWCILWLGDVFQPLSILIHVVLPLCASGPDSIFDGQSLITALPSLTWRHLD